MTTIDAAMEKTPADDLAGPERFAWYAPLPPEQQPLVAVVVPVHNGAAHIAGCVRSVLEQTYRNWELVIVDNASEDGTSAIATEVAAGDDRVELRYDERLSSVYHNHNRALASADPDAVYVKVLHADDLLHPEALMQMVALAEANPGVGLVSAYRMLGDHLAGDERLPIDRTVFDGREIGRRGLLSATGLFGTPSSVLIRRSDLPSRAEIYNEGNLHGDSELCFEILSSSDFGFVHQVLSYSRMHEDSVTSRHRGTATMLPAHIGILMRHGPAFLDDEQVARRLSSQMRHYSWLLLKRTLRGTPWRNPRFVPYHRRELENITAGAAAGGASRSARAAVAPWRGVIALLDLVRRR